MAEWVSFLGLAAGICTTASFIPQVVKSWKTKETKDLSLIMLILLAVGVGLWLTYGILTKDMPIILANIVSFPFTLSLLVIKIIYG